VLHSDPPTADEITEDRALITETLAEAGDVPVGRAARWVGVAGTFTTLSALAQGLGEYDPKRIHGSVISLDRMRAVCARLVTSTVTERRSLGPMHPGRAEVIGGGSIVVQALCDVLSERAGLSALTVSEKDLLGGKAMSVLTRVAS
jgi:exopolyphosphatase/guanosine-5'-triphosphate,3'-diphosphate pyrophosphatase